MPGRAVTFVTKLRHSLNPPTATTRGEPRLTLPTTGELSIINRRKYSKVDDHTGANCAPRSKQFFTDENVRIIDPVRSCNVILVASIE